MEWASAFRAGRICIGIVTRLQVIPIKVMQRLIGVKQERFNGFVRPWRDVPVQIDSSELLRQTDQRAQRGDGCHGTNQVAFSPVASHWKRARRFPSICKTSQSIESIRPAMAIKLRRLFSVSSRVGAFLSRKSGRPDDGLSNGVPGGSTAQ